MIVLSVNHRAAEIAVSEPPLRAACMWIRSRAAVRLTSGRALRLDDEMYINPVAPRDAVYAFRTCTYANMLLHPKFAIAASAWTLFLPPTDANKLTMAQHCPQAMHLPSSLTNTSFSALPSLFQSASGPQDPVAIDAIRNTLALYPLAVDGKDFAALSEVFISDAVANYSAPLNVLTPLDTIESVLQGSLATVNTQHSYGTQVIQLFGPCVARSVTYFRAAHFGIGIYEGQIASAYGQYRDVLVLLEEGWRIKERTLAYMVCLSRGSSIALQPAWTATDVLSPRVR